ncbi:hypothetical protein KSF78_0003149 [Schistosoma japonicum]|nr:hypothetical protein KSF78_0003149 [Schistosoma japonicum]
MFTFIIDSGNTCEVQKCRWVRSILRIWRVRLVSGGGEPDESLDDDDEMNDTPTGLDRFTMRECSVSIVTSAQSTC